MTYNTHFLQSVSLRKTAIALALPIVSTMVPSATVFAQTDRQSSELEEIIVKAHPLHEKGLSQMIDVLRGQELADALASNLGDTLAQQPGIRSASFGAASGRPVIHGLGGARVKTTEDTIDSLDVSVTSTDHAVTVEPFIANQITVLKGASTLLYGSGAIGGVVDTETGRIPTQLNEENFSGRGEVQATDNGNGKTAALRFDGNLSDNLAWHVDGFTKQADDYEIPGFAESATFRALEEAEHGDEEEHQDEDGHDDEDGHEGEEEVFGILEGSRFDIQGYAGGLSWVDGDDHLGFSISGIDGSYGLVGGHGHEEEHGDEEEHDDEEHEEEHEEGEEEPGRIDIKQTRLDFSGKLASSFDLIDSFSFRVGINDYEHSEIEGNGELGTFFENDAWEARFFANHSEIAGFDGVLGLQMSDREFSAIGEEAFVPPSTTDSVGLFWVGEREYDNFSLELGSRVESLDTDSENSGNAITRSFTTFSTSIGGILPLSESTTITALFDYAQRAPSIEELFSNGPHLATQTFEIGDSQLDKESSANLTLSYGYESDSLDAHVSIYHYQFDDFIYQSNTGEEEDELPVLVYQQNDADFTGMDIEVGIHLFEVASGDLDLRLTYDFVEADLKGGSSTNLPRIPSNRLGADLVWNTDLWQVKLSFADIAAQRDNAPFELATDSYQDISAKVQRKFTVGDADITAFIHGKNLSDEEQRNHTSFVKDVAPSSGRRVEAGIRFNF